MIHNPFRFTASEDKASIPEEYFKDGQFTSTRRVTFGLHSGRRLFSNELYLGLGSRPRFYIKSVLALLGLAMLMKYIPETNSLFLKIFEQVLAGVLIAHLVQLQHEVIHQYEGKRKPLDRWWGMILGLPMLVSFSRWHRDHMRHHRNPSPETEHFGYALATVLTPTRFAFHVSNIRHYWDFFKYAVLLVVSKKARLEAGIKIIEDYILIITFISALLVASLTDSDISIFQSWLIPLLIAGLAHTLIELPEHFARSSSGQFVYGDAVAIRTNRIVEWLTNGNNYHLEHHRYPEQTISQLYRIRAMLSRSNISKPLTYGEYYSQLWHSIHKRDAKVSLV